MAIYTKSVYFYIKFIYGDVKMKKLIAMALAATLIFGATACSSSEESSSETITETQQTTAATTVTETPAEPVTVKVAALKGPTGMGMVKMMDDTDNGIENTNKYEFSIVGAVDEMTAKIVKGDADIAAVPANLASVLYSNTKGEVEVVAINTLGVIYIVENGDTIHSVADLKGKTIFASGKGASPEYALNFMLTENGLDPEKDVDIQWKSEHTECVAALGSTENAIAMLPQPFVAVGQAKNDKIRIAIDMTKEWDKSQEGKENPSTMLTGVVVARKGFIESNPDALSKFLDDYKVSVDFINSNLEAGAKLVGEYDIVPEAVALKAIPYCNITFIEGAEMKTKLSGYLNVLFEQNPKSVGGALPDDNFYYSREEIK